MCYRPNSNLHVHVWPMDRNPERLTKGPLYDCEGIMSFVKEFTLSWEFEVLDDWVSLGLFTFLRTRTHATCVRVFVDHMRRVQPCYMYMYIGVTSNLTF